MTEPTRTRRLLGIAGTVLVVALVLCGLVFVGLVVLFFVAFNNNYGSNK